MSAPRRPGLLTDLGAAVLALVLVGIAGALGKWQYDAWQAHREAEARDLSGVTPVPLDDVMGADDPFPAPDLGRPVEVRGEWLDGGFWVADREQDGRAGYWAVDPLQVGDAAVLVVRGWAPEPDADLLAVQRRDRADRLAAGPRREPGHRRRPRRRRLPRDPGRRRHPARRRRPLLRLPRRPGARSRAARGPSSAALPSPSTFTGVRNLLYAFEWWVFGGFAAFIWWRWRRDATAPEVTDLDRSAAG